MAAIAYPQQHEDWAPPGRPERAPGPLRLVSRPAPVPPAVLRRRRAVALLGAVVVSAGLFLVASGAVGPGAGAPDAAGSTLAGAGADAGTIVVQPGDTYWSIARGLDGDGADAGDVRDVVDRLVAANDGRPLVPGVRLRLVQP